MVEPYSSVHSSSGAKPKVAGVGLWVSKHTYNSWKSLVEAVVGFLRIVLGEMVETCRRW